MWGMALWLLKTEPSEYSWDDLVREKSAVWSGVTNNAALLHLRAMQKGDEALIYHTGEEKRIVGLAAITRGAYPDPQLDPPDPKRVVVDLKPKKKANTPASLASIKSDKRFASFDLVRNSRLSVMPVPDDLGVLLRSMSGL